MRSALRGELLESFLPNYQDLSFFLSFSICQKILRLSIIYLCYIARNANARASAKRQSARHKKTDDKQSEKRKKRISQRRKPALDRCDDETANLNRVLVERMLLKNSGFNQGSRSVGGTPMCLRRRKHDVNKNLSPMRVNDNSSVVRPSVIENEIVKRRSNSVRSKFNLCHIYDSSF